MHNDNDLPVLSSVVKAGNESIIETTRLGHALLDELEALKYLDANLDTTPSAEVDDTVDTPRPGVGDGSVVHLEAECSDDHHTPLPTSTTAATTATMVDAEVTDATDHEQASYTRDIAAQASGDNDEDLLELLIDDLVDRHVSALRQDLRQLLLRSQTT